MDSKYFEKEDGFSFDIYIIDGICFWFIKGYCHFNYLEEIEKEIEKNNRN